MKPHKFLLIALLAWGCSDDVEKTTVNNSNPNNATNNANNLNNLNNGDPSITVSPQNFRVSAGTSHSCAIDGSGSLFCWGSNLLGRLGNGSPQDQMSPTPVEPAGQWRSVTAGHMHTCGVQKDGSLWCWGFVNEGLLGIVTPEDSVSTPQQIGQDTDWATVQTGYAHTCGLKTDGTLWCWGNNFSGATGHGATERVHSPRIVGENRRWTKFSVAGNSTCATRVDGELLCWGYRSGDGYMLDPKAWGTYSDWTQLGIGADLSCGVREGGSLWCWGGVNERAIIEIDAGPWQSASAGINHACAMRAEGDVACFGSGQFGKLGNGLEDDSGLPVSIGQFDEISLGANHGCGLRGEQVFCWGYNDHGQVGSGLSGFTFDPEQVGTASDWAKVSAGPFTTCALRTDGTMWCFGDNEGETIIDTPRDQFVEPVLTRELWKWADVQVGETLACGQRTIAQARCWGTEVGSEYRLEGFEAPDEGTWSQFSVRSKHVCGVTSLGGLFCGGDNDGGKLGPDTYETLAEVPSETPWRQVAAGGSHSCAVKSDGTMWCWGRTDFGTLGPASPDGEIASRTPVPVGADTDWDRVWAGVNYTCASKTDGSLWCWGRGTDQARDSNDSDIRKTPFKVLEGGVLALSATAEFSCAVKSDGSLWCWGTSWPNVVPDYRAPFQVGTDTDWTGVSGHDRHMCGVKSSGTLWCWGDGRVGQTGLGKFWQTVPAAVEGL